MRKIEIILVDLLLCIPSEFKYDLIGPKGSKIKEIQKVIEERLGFQIRGSSPVQIDPRNTSGTHDVIFY